MKKVFSTSEETWKTSELDTYNKGLVNLAVYDPWPCAKVAAIGECRIDSC